LATSRADHRVNDIVPWATTSVPGFGAQLGPDLKHEGQGPPMQFTATDHLSYLVAFIHAIWCALVYTPSVPSKSNDDSAHEKGVLNKIDVSHTCVDPGETEFRS
jgi:hypothetical protein